MYMYCDLAVLVKFPLHAPSLLMFSQSLFRAPYAAPVNWNFKTGSGSAAAKDRIAINKDTKHIDVDAVGTVNGVSVHEFDLDSVDDKPWRKPGKSCDIHSLLQVMQKCVASFELSESKVGKRDHGEQWGKGSVISGIYKWYRKYKYDICWSTVEPCHTCTVQPPH